MVGTEPDAHRSVASRNSCRSKRSPLREKFLMPRDGGDKTADELGAAVRCQQNAPEPRTGTCSKCHLGEQDQACEHSSQVDEAVLLSKIRQIHGHKPDDEHRNVDRLTLPRFRC